MVQPDIHDVFVARLRETRLALGVSQNELGRRMGLPESSAGNRINRYESGEMRPTLESAQAVADALGVSLSYLVCADPERAELIAGFDRLTPDARQALLKKLQTLMRSAANIAATSEPKATPPKPRRRVRR